MRLFFMGFIALTSLAYAEPQDSFESLRAEYKPYPTRALVFLKKLPHTKFSIDEYARNPDERRFVVYQTPDLKIGQKYSYQMQSSWLDEKGNIIKVRKTVIVEAGKITEVDLSKPEDLDFSRAPTRK